MARSQRDSRCPRQLVPIPRVYPPQWAKTKCQLPIARPDVLEIRWNALAVAMRSVVERMAARLPWPLSVTMTACSLVPEDPLDIRGGTASGAITTACVGAVGTPGPRPAPAAEPFLSGASDPGPRGRRRVCAQPTPATATTGASGCSLALNHVDFQLALPVPVGCRPARKHGSQRYASPYRNLLAPAATWPGPRPGPDRSRTDSSAWLPQTNSNGRAGGC